LYLIIVFTKKSVSLPRVHKRTAAKIMTEAYKRYIDVTKEDRDFIAKAFNITDRMVMKGIRYESDSDLAIRVRKLALKRGGKIMVVVPEDELPPKPLM